MVRFLISAAAAVIAALGMAVLVAVVIGVASLSPDLAYLREANPPLFKHHKKLSIYRPQA